MNFGMAISIKRTLKLFNKASSFRESTTIVKSNNLF